MQDFKLAFTVSLINFILSNQFPSQENGDILIFFWSDFPDFYDLRYRWPTGNEIVMLPGHKLHQIRNQSFWFNFLARTTPKIQFKTICRYLEKHSFPRLEWNLADETILLLRNCAYEACSFYESGWFPETPVVFCYQRRVTAYTNCRHLKSRTRTKLLPGSMFRHVLAMAITLPCHTWNGQ